MKKKTLTITSLLTIAASIGGVMWIPSTLSSTQKLINKPAIEHCDKLFAELSEKHQTWMAGMKFYDMHTDALVNNIRDIKNDIKDIEEELENYSIRENLTDREKNSKRFLKGQLQKERGKLRKIQDQLDDATRQDRRILTELSGISV